MQLRSNPKTIVSLVVALTALFFTGCAKDTLSQVSYTVEEFVQNTSPEIDILWVVDNSNSMAANQNGIGESFQAFINNLVETGVDYHIGVVSTDTADGGLLHTGVSGEPVIDSTTIGPQTAFLDNVQVGVFGSASEKAFEAASLALGVGLGQWNPGNDPVPPNNGFIRDAATLFIIMVSDEDDKSFGPVSYYRKLFESYKGPGNESMISVSSIVGDPGVGCSGTIGNAQPGDRYIDLASQTGGVFASICDEFSETLRELSLTASGLKSRFELTAIPDLSTSLPCGTLATAPFCVKVNEVAVPMGDNADGWTYNESSNSILFGANSVPEAQSNITVKFRGFPR